MYYIALESYCFEASACAGAASFSLLELELEPERHPYVEISEFRAPAPADTACCGPAPDNTFTVRNGHGNLDLYGKFIKNRLCSFVHNMGKKVP
jgi:hypothetical protein